MDKSHAGTPHGRHKWHFRQNLSWPRLQCEFMVKSSYTTACVHRSLKKHPFLSTLAQLIVEQNGSPGGSGLRRGRASFQQRSLTLMFYSRCRPTAETRFHLRAFSAECGKPQPRKRGRRQRRRRHPGAGAGEARTIAVAISFPAAAVGTAAAGSGSTGLRVGVRERCCPPALESHAKKGRRRRTTHAAGASGTSKAPSVHRGEEEEARPKQVSGRLQAGCHSTRLQCLLAKASAAGAAAARRMPRPHGRRRDSRCSRHPTRAPDIRGCW